MDFATVGHWLTTLRGRGLADRTVHMYAYAVFRAYIEHSVNGELGPLEAAAFLASLGRRAAARRQYHQGLKSFFSWAVATGAVERDPMIVLPKVAKPRRPPKVALSAEELTRYLVAAAWRNEKRAWALMLTYSIGARRMEVAGIRPEDVMGDRIYLRSTKGDKPRWVEANAWALAAVNGLLPYSNGTLLGGADASTITGWAHQAAVDSDLYRKVKGRVAHVLRASFITHLLYAGTPLPVVSGLVGHENISTTDAYAAIIQESDRRVAVDRLVKS